MTQLYVDSIFGFIISECEHLAWLFSEHHCLRAISLLLVSKIFEGFNRLGQVAVELSHAGGEERVNHRAREEATQVCVEETEHLGFVGFSVINGIKRTHTRKMK